MRFLTKFLLVIAVLGGVGRLGYRPLRDYLDSRNTVSWETAEVVRGDLVVTRESTGTVKPVLSVSVGSFVSGPIVELNVDFNAEVKQGDILAKVDPRLFIASVRRDEASLATRRAEVERIEAQLQQAVNNYNRGKMLRKKNVGYLSDREMDQLTAEVKVLQAQRKLAKASILQAEAALETSRANLNYCEITAPVDGIVIDRKIDPGQTLAAQFQTPELFIVAPDLRKKVHVFASVDEADIGLIQKARKEKRRVTFKVDAHPGEVFTGEIEQIRVSATTTQNVVTYPVVIAAQNPDLKLLPNMTAEIVFEVNSAQDVLKLPRSALRFFPTDIRYVREPDRRLIDGSNWQNPATKDSTDKSADKKAEKPDAPEPDSVDQDAAGDEDAKTHVWVADGQVLRAVEIKVGLEDSEFAEIIEADLQAGDRVVTAQKES